MSHELIYTSAPKGLKPGTRGFCTVAMTHGMPPQLIERLESLSGYRQVFAPQDPQAALNPVVQSHLRISVAGRNFHVLSRICAAGLDYSQRANKFAHHLVLDTGEMPAAGPAWALAQRGVMESAWDGATKILPTGRHCPAGNMNPAVCVAWQQATGDAGWGGVLAETAIDKAKSIVTIIFRPGLDPLPLIAESLALLPPDVRRNVTFSSYYTKLPPGVECQWRCVIEGSPESKVSAGLVINLCRPLPPAQGGKFVAAARTGRIAQTAAAPMRSIHAERPDDLELEHLLQSDDRPARRGEQRTHTPATSDISSLEPLPPSLPDSFDASLPESTLLKRRKPRLKQPARWPIAVAVAAIIAILAGGGLALTFAHKDPDLAKTDAPVAPVTPPAGNGPVKHNPETADKQKAEKEKLAKEKAEQERIENAKAERQKAETQRLEKEAADKAKAAETAAKRAKAARAKAERERVEKLQAALDGLASQVPVRFRAATVDGPIPVGPFDFALARDCKLTILGAAGAFGDQSAFELKPPDAGLPKSTNPIAWVCNIDGKPQAEFAFSPSGLNFRWLPADRSARDIQRANQLCNCVLQVALGKQTKAIALRVPTRNDAGIALNLLGEKKSSVSARHGAKFEIKHPPFDFTPQVELLGIEGAADDIVAGHPDKVHCDQFQVHAKRAGKEPAGRVPLLLVASPEFDKTQREVAVAVDAGVRPGVWEKYLRKGATRVGGDATETVVHLTPFAIENDVLDGLNTEKIQLDDKIAKYNKLSEDDQTKNAADNKKDAAELDEVLRQIAAAKDLKSLEEMLIGHDSKATVRYRIYMTVEGVQVDLVAPADERPNDRGP